MSLFSYFKRSLQLTGHNFLLVTPNWEILEVLDFTRNFIRFDILIRVREVLIVGDKSVWRWMIHVELGWKEEYGFDEDEGEVLIKMEVQWQRESHSNLNLTKVSPKLEALGFNMQGFIIGAKLVWSTIWLLWYVPYFKNDTYALFVYSLS